LPAQQHLLCLSPGAAPVRTAGACQAHAILETNRKFQVAVQEFNLYLNVQLLITNQILEAVPNCYLEILEDNEEEYDNMTIEQMMIILPNLQDKASCKY